MAVVPLDIQAVAPPTRRLAILPWLLALVFVALIVLPLLMGVWIERVIRQQINSLSQSSPFAVSVDYYQRGWLSSRLFTHTSLGGLTFNHAHTVSHGPVNFEGLVSDLPLLTFATVISRPISSQHKPPTTITRLDFDGDIHTRAVPSSFKPSAYSTDTGVVTTSTIAAQLHQTKNTNTVSGWATVNAANITTHLFELNFKDLIVRANRQHRANYTFIETQFEVGQIDLKGGGEKASLTRNWIQLSADSEQSGTNVRATGSIAELYWRDEQFFDLTFDVILRKLPNQPEGWQALFGQSSRDSNAPPESLADIVLQHFTNGVEVELADLQFKHRGTDVKAWVRASTTPYLLVDSGSTTNAMDTLFHAIDLQAEFVADESIVFDLLERRTRDVINRTEQFGEMITFSDDEAAPLVKGSVESQLSILRRQRYLDYVNGAYSAKLAMRNGQVSINGKPVTLQQIVR